MQNVKLLPTKAQPSVYAEWLKAGDAPTVIVYGHYGMIPYSLKVIISYQNLIGSFFVGSLIHVLLSILSRLILHEEPQLKRCKRAGFSGRSALNMQMSSLLTP